MQDEVERVARALCRQAIGYCERWDLDKRVDDEWGCWIPQARAAMAATREIDAEAMSNTLLPATWNRHDCADWLQQRANDVKEAGNG
jgi:hypothetical protein